MKNGMLLMAAVAGGLMAPGGVAFGQDKSDCPKAGAPAMVEGQVTQVNAEQGRLTLRAADGALHEFQASKTTIEGYKAGDPIKARLRKPAHCD